MNDAEFLRYSRQLLVEGFSESAQQRLAAARVLIVGLGGLGCPAALYLAGAGVGNIVLADGDRIEVSNLPRQALFTTADIGQLKTHAARRQLQARNPHCRIEVLPEQLSDRALNRAVASADLVLDCCDNMITRQALNAACVAHGKPLVSASASGMNGQIAVLAPPWSHGCLHCLWPGEAEPEANCRSAGILGPVVGMMGTYQALAAIKLLAGVSPAVGQLTLFDGIRLGWQTLALTADPHCPVCGGANERVA